MLALQKVKPQSGGGLGTAEVDIPTPGVKEVLLRVEAAGICGTDMHIYQWTPWIAGRMKLPTTLGHEMCGVIEAVGPGVEQIKAGDHVSVESHISCGHCHACRIGWSHVCSNTRYPGIDLNGGFARYAVLPEKICWRVPPDLDFSVGALFEPLGIAVHASMESEGVSGKTVLISGCGPIGLMNVTVARALGAHCIIAVDVNAQRLALAENLGATRLINPQNEDVVSVVQKMTRGDGVDVVIEYSGTEQGLDNAVDCVAHGGEIRLVGVPSGKVSIEMERWIFKGIRVASIHGRRMFATWETLSRLVHENRIDLRPLISHTLPIQEAARGFELITRGEACKVIISPAI